MKKTLILASASPRRSEILRCAGYDFQIITSTAAELTHGEGAYIATQNALAKARQVLLGCNGDFSVVLGADTVVLTGNKVLGKPKNADEATEMLLSLSNGTHSVITGYGVVDGKEEKVGFCETVVSFRQISLNEARQYVATGEPFDKAGGYGIQERASLFVKSIKGDYFNIMGLPVAHIYHPLKQLGIYPEWQKVLL